MLLDKTDDAKIEKIVQQAGCFLYMVTLVQSPALCLVPQALQ